MIPDDIRERAMHLFAAADGTETVPEAVEIIARGLIAERAQSASQLEARDQMAKALEAMLKHSCVADTDGNDKDAEDHEAERMARSALALAQLEARAPEGDDARIENDFFYDPRTGRVAGDGLVAGLHEAERVLAMAGWNGDHEWGEMARKASKAVGDAASAISQQDGLVERLTAGLRDARSVMADYVETEPMSWGISAMARALVNIDAALSQERSTDDGK